MSLECSKSVRDAYSIGKEEYEKYGAERLVSRTASIYDTMKINKLPLFRQKNIVRTPKTKLQILSLKADCQLFSYPVALSEYGKLRKTDKFLFLDCLEKMIEPCYSAPGNMEMLAIDGAAFVHMNPPRQSKTFKDYCEVEIANRVKKVVPRLDRVDLIFDVYRDDSVKSETRDRRGSTFKISVKDSTPMVKDFKKFLLHNDNKTQLFSRIADAMSQCLQGIPTTIISTKDAEVVSNSPVDLSSLCPCNHEEADTRIFVHVNDAASKGLQKIVVRTVDTHVVVIALGLFFELDITELWIEFGSGRKKRWLPIHSYAQCLGSEKCSTPCYFGMPSRAVILFPVLVVVGKKQPGVFGQPSLKSQGLLLSCHMGLKI